MKARREICPLLAFIIFPMEFKIDNAYFVKDITLDVIATKPAVYRWWFDVIPSKIIQGGVDTNRIMSQTINNKTWYALYVGKASNARRRLRNHLPHNSQQTFRTSTLRRTLRALLCNPNLPEEECALLINNFMNEHAYLEWGYYLTDKEAKHYESLYISNGYYPLNNSENIDSLKIWTRQMTMLRKQWNEAK